MSTLDENILWKKVKFRITVQEFREIYGASKSSIVTHLSVDGNS